jgi:hypothetical protein
LTSVEQSLVEYVGRGQQLNLAAEGEAVDEAAMRLWGESRACRATVIRNILRGRLVADPDPHGLRLRGAKITGRLDLRNLITNVHLELADCLLEEGVLARDARLGSVVLTGCQLEHSTEPPLDCTRLTCSVLFLDGARIIGHANDGAVRLNGAYIGGPFNCMGAELDNDSGPALNADYMRVGQSMPLCRGFTATGSGDGGAVSLIGAHIGFLDCSGAKLHNDSGAALNAANLQVDQDVLLCDDFSVTGSGDGGAVNLIGAHIGGQLNCIGAKLHNGSGPALYADSLQVEQHMFLCDEFAATGGGEGVTVDLTDARVVGKFEFAPARLEHKVDSHRLAVDGLTYAGVPERISPEGWRELLRHGTPDYAAQPYQQLAAGYRGRGDDRQARQTLMAQRDDQLTRADTSRPERWWGWITKITLGYGYQPWRALLFLTAVVAVSCVLAVTLGAHGALAQTSTKATPDRSCTVVQQVSVGLELNLPAGTSEAVQVNCNLSKDSASATAAWLTAIGWVLRLLAWVFAALFIAGFTSAVRKT